MKSLSALFAFACSAAVFAAPMIDEAHDRVQTTLDPGLERIGTLTPRSAREIGPSRLAIGCEMLPRGYGDFEKFKEYMPPLGLARVRLHAGWAKLEPEKGRWDFAWLDRQVNWLIEHGLEPLLETSYGNPAYPGGGGASLSDGLPHGEEALKAWDNYVEQLARHYPQVRNWACWNEPNNIKDNTPEMVAENNIRTARIIKRLIPDAKIGMLSLSWCNIPYTKACLKVFREQNALELFHWIIMHDYTPNPDAYYGLAESWAKVVRAEAPHLRIWNGESGGTSDAHYSAPVSSRKWNSELTQAKWDARRLVGDLGHDFDSLVFTMYDPCYDSPERYCNKVPSYWISSRPDRFMKRMGLLKCNDRFEVTKVKMAYYTVQNIATLFDATVEPVKFGVKFEPERKVDVPAVYTFRRKDTKDPVIAFWNASRHPVNENAVERAVISVRGLSQAFRSPVWVDMVSGAIYEIPASKVVQNKPGAAVFEDVPFYDAPAVITERELVMAGVPRNQ